MSEVKHTPGPWSLVYTEERLELGGGLEQSTGVHSLAGFGLIANVIYKKTNILGDSKTLQYKTFEANARLIASAPDILESLEELVHEMTMRRDIHGWSNPKIQKAQEAIKKAKGL